MTLAAGDTLGPYEIVGTLGAGGMGTVYRAQDTRLNRPVAIKVVGGTLTSDVDVLEREARAVAALNHPHICALHDLRRENDLSFLVMEYVDGETLADRIARGPLPLRDVLHYSIQIAEALDHAHKHGVLHRDLKPANIMLTRSGAKVLDFGLAMLQTGAAVQMPLDKTPTAYQQITSESTLLGTVHYVAPERLEGRETTAVSDLFAFGAVVYEMCTGRRAFESDSPAGVIAAILHSDPPRPSTLRADVPAALEWVTLKCLAKIPEARWQSAADIVEVLRWIARMQEPQVERVPAWRRAVPLAAMSA
ncbi:MAG TPA: serine/threonine-protein kinase, partial [Vicinamibacterales bacterium]|nr:serine/threonine-protein kinase [Vicinamibacterales bacterium]